MIVAGWLLYGLMTALAVNFFFPVHELAGLRMAIVLGLFMLLGGLDYVASLINRGEKIGL